jgi:hypothetical protein
MNYVQHTRVAHERLRTRPDARPHHVSLYWALFFAWNAQFFDPDGVQLHAVETMQAARIGNERTYRATLYDLEAWGLIRYLPSHSRHHSSRCQLTDLSGAEVPPVNPVTGGTSALSKNSLPGVELPQALQVEVPPAEGLSGAKVPEHSLLDKTGSTKTSVQNGSTAATQKKIGEVYAGEGLSEAQVLDDYFNDEQPSPSAAPKTSRIKANQVAQKKKGVGEATARPEQRRSRSALLPELPFRESPLYDLTTFIAAFAGTDYELADLRHYHQLIDTWRDKKTGLPPTRKDWVATARRFMLNDAADNRLKLAPATQPASQSAVGHQDPMGSGIPVTGYRSKRWD